MPQKTIMTIMIMITLINTQAIAILRAITMLISTKTMIQITMLLKIIMTATMIIMALSKNILITKQEMFNTTKQMISQEDYNKTYK
jgi:hypothetical protein